ncbi:phospholipase/carboxylesterase [Leifsonia sp. AK011]|uniref:alpha/beta hydrolase n=1 Tax=Leifsonia sp. AK011 TaxID=2723075 RepID=UPI0015C96FD7|nr:alpha/beta fold hydrolase [Leifsonia sp. AK011]NYF09597.1 phospholipase/carboxylesterase [Leifsonia sp. AK011]
MNLDTSAVLWSAPERERAGRPLLVLLHGYGSHEGDLFALSPALPLGPVVASVRAPLRESGGFAWWSLDGATPGAPDADAVDAAAIAVLDWLDTLEYTSVSILGFSQGGAMTLQLLRHAPERFAAAVCLAGFVPTATHPGDARLAEVRPPVFWGRGTSDPVIPDYAVERTTEWLPGHADATIRIYEGLGHSISTEELTDFAGFLGAHS